MRKLSLFMAVVSLILSVVVSCKNETKQKVDVSAQNDHSEKKRGLRHEIEKVRQRDVVLSRQKH